MRTPRNVAGHGRDVVVHMDADLVQEATRVAVRRTLLEVRDLVDGIPTEEPDSRSYDRKPRDPAKYRDDLLAELRRLMEATDDH